MHRDDFFSDTSLEDVEKWTSALTEAEQKPCIILYSLPSCPMCQTLKRLLENAKISFIIEEDALTLTKHNIYHVPVLSINEQHLDFPEALRWVKANEHSRQN